MNYSFHPVSDLRIGELCYAPAWKLGECKRLLQKLLGGRTRASYTPSLGDGACHLGVNVRRPQNTPQIKTTRLLCIALFLKAQVHNRALVLTYMGRKATCLKAQARKPCAVSSALEVPGNNCTCLVPGFTHPGWGEGAGGGLRSFQTYTEAGGGEGKTSKDEGKRDEHRGHVG